MNGNRFEVGSQGGLKAQLLQNQVGLTVKPSLRALVLGLLLLAAQPTTHASAHTVSGQVFEDSPWTFLLEMYASVGALSENETGYIVPGYQPMATWHSAQFTPYNGYAEATVTGRGLWDGTPIGNNVTHTFDREYPASWSGTVEGMVDVTLGNHLKNATTTKGLAGPSDLHLVIAQLP